ncbi:PEP-CTERM sorting domain-containing protein [Roseateles cellulosilyticus]|uniref:PEP-CTERM sorting domain-containing protein n=1 Tax=Pelomonas cellulosilytica TaxID=2906762 RepID=A0ABS8XS30_9BURK|nr:PEP-CTERM sorting domain-containing protein [Pelomonas sp. P8]MCE4554678.1 PEP-CTERM sorting domain-containing protein [Pelomonas sp. P8]
MKAFQRLALCAALSTALPAFADLIDDLNGDGTTAPPTPRVWWTGGPKVSVDQPRFRLDLSQNWSSALAMPDDVGFGSGARTTSLTNGGSFVARSMRFDGYEAYTLDGNAIQLQGNLYNGSTVRQIIAAELVPTGGSSQSWDGGGAGMDVRLTSQVADRLTMMNINANVVGTFKLKREIMSPDYGRGVALNLTYGGLNTPGGAAITGGWEQASMLLVRSTWTSGNTLQIGGGTKSAQVELQKSARIDAHQLTLAQNGRLTLDGGDLSFDSMSRSGNGLLNWVRGTVEARGALELGALGPTVALSNDRFLKVAGTLTVASGQTLTMTGKSLLTTPELHLAGGVLQVNMLGGEAPVLSGYGQWRGSVTGATTINAAGGRLRIGDETRAGAVMLSGPMTLAAGASVQLDSLDLAHLGSSTTLVAGNVLASAHGIALDTGRQLFARNGGTLQGLFVNDGTVSTRRRQGGSSAGAGLLTLVGDVTGTGRFDGAFSFLDGLSPGANLGTGMGTLAFGGSEVWLGPQSSLTLDIAAGPNGWTGDRLDGIGRLHAGGELHLRFHGVVPQAGQSWQALSFSQLDGSFSHITLEGLDGWQVDGTQLLASGRISVTAVPEPASVALLALGLAVLPWCRRRSSSWNQNAAR